MKRLCGLWLCLALCFLGRGATAGEVIPDGLGKYGVELDVFFSYEPDSLERWEQVFKIASGKIYRASSGEVYLKKVNFIVCPFEIESGQSSASADVTIRRGQGISFSPGTISGSRSGGVVFYDEGTTVEDDGRVMGHELAHYIFEIFDEYKKTKHEGAFQTIYNVADLNVSDPANLQAFFDNLAEEGIISVIPFQSETDRLIAILDDPFVGGLVSADELNGSAITRLNFRQFCTKPVDEIDPRSDACIMDAGIVRGNGTASTGNYYELLCDTHDHSSGVATYDPSDNTVIWSKNAQAKSTGKSCATVARDVWIKKHKGFLKLNGTLVGGDGPEPEFEEKDTCNETVVLLLDKSGSMSGARIANLKRAAIGLIDSLDDDTKLGIVWFDSQPQAAVGIQELGTARVLAKQAIAGVDASGGTRIAFGLGVAYQQLLLLRDPDEARPEEIIFLITDGESSDDPTTVVNTIAADGVKINPVSIGTDTDFSFLQEMAVLTSGTFYFSADDDDIARVVTQGATENLEGYSLISEETLDPVSSPLEFEIDPFVSNLLVQLELKDIDTNGLSENDFSLLLPGGGASNAVVRFTAFDADSALVTFELPQPSEGRYQILLPQSNLRETSTATRLLLAQSSTLRMFAGIDLEGKAQFPEPVVLTAGVTSDLGSVSGIDVTADIRRPDGSVVSIVLRDDGNPSNGDVLAGDGVYSASFQQYNADGPYSVELVADNSADTGTLGYGMHQPATDTKVGAFTRRTVLSFEVENYAAPAGGVLTLSNSTTPPPRQLFSSRKVPYSSVVVANFQAQTGPGQDVVVESLELALSTDEVDLTGFEEFLIYVDGDKDGMIDFTGEFSRPLSRVQPTIEDSRVVLRDLVTLPADSNLDLLVVAVYQAKVSVNTDLGLPLNAGIPLLGLLLSGLLASVAKRRRHVVAAGCLALISLSVLGCSTGNQDFVRTSNSNVTPVESEVVLNTQVGTVRSQLSLDSVKAAGAIDRQPITVGLPADLNIQGPEIVVETQVP